MQSWLAQATQKSIGTVARRAQQQALPAARPRTFVTIANTTFRRQRLPTALVLCTQEGKKGAIVAFGRQQQQRFLETEAEFHPIADQTLETIQDAMDAVFDGQPAIEYEVSLANGVLNLSLPPHGTWVINKQSPNRQIWVRDNINLYAGQHELRNFKKAKLTNYSLLVPCSSCFSLFDTATTTIVVEPALWSKAL
jgi:iron donor protein CyaY